jgi:uncharacterized protein
MKKLTIVLFILVFQSIFAQKNAYDIARSGTLEEIKSLYKKDSLSLYKPNETGYTPLILACYRGNNEVANFLINKKITLDYGSGLGTALMAATYKENTEIVKLLIEKGANINLTDANGQTVLMLAIFVKNKEIIQLLLNKKIDVEARDNNKKQAIDYALMTNDQEIIKLITKTNNKN